MKYYGYGRVSTETQAEKGYGLDVQEQSIRKYAADNGITLDGLYVDAGISGNMKDTDDDSAISKREGLMELLAMLEEGDVVIVLNTSRLWRSDMTKAIIRRELLKRGAKLVSIEQPKYDLYTKDPNDYLINAIMEALDVYERMSISMKLARGRTVKAKGGDKPAGVCPIGYRYSADKKSVEVDPEEAGTYRYPKFVYKGQLLPTEGIEMIVNGNIVEEAIHLLREPPAMAFAKGRQQVTTIPMKLLQSPLSKTDMNLAVEDYLITRVAHVRRGRGQPRILYETVCAAAGVTDRKQKERVPERVKKILSYWVECSFITDFESDKKGVTVIVSKE